MGMGYYPTGHEGVGSTWQVRLLPIHAEDWPSCTGTLWRNRLFLDRGAGVVLAGRAQAKTIFWQTAAGANFGITSRFKGNVLTITDISVQNINQEYSLVVSGSGDVGPQRNHRRSRALRLRMIGRQDDSISCLATHSQFRPTLAGIFSPRGARSPTKLTSISRAARARYCSAGARSDRLTVISGAACHLLPSLFRSRPRDWFCG
jgi:hypothetical protein